MVTLKRPHWGAPARWPRETRDTLFLIAVTGWTVAPHLGHLPAWCTAGVVALLGWRAALALRGAALPGRWTIIGLLTLAAMLTWWREGTLLGKEAGVTLLVMLMALKTLELRARRDALVIFFLGFFIVLTQFLYSQSLLTAAAMLVSVWGLLTALVLSHMPVGRPSLARAGGVAARAALLGAPVMLALFVFFPRVGPLWGLPGDAAGRTGLSGTLRLGEMAEIAADETIALRLRFDGPAPPPSSLYFRGPVLSHFDGRAWLDERQATSRRFAGDEALNGSPWQAATRWPLDLALAGPPLRYEMMLEPHHLTMLPLLEGTAAVTEVQPEGALPRLRLQPDLQWRSPTPVADRLRIQARAWAEFTHGAQAPAIGLRDLVDLPPGRNPRTLAWAAELRRQPAYAEADARTLTQAVLAHIRRENFRYTIAPGLYGDDAVDEFWLERREGFCEHFAAAFVVVMRALDVPARIVTGYQGTDPQPVDDWWVVRRSHAHAWAEVWQPGEGWLRVDPTAAVAPERIVRSLALRPAPGLIGQALSAVNPDLLLQIRRAWERVDQRWNQWVLGYTKTQQSSFMKQLGIDTPDVATLSRLLLGGLGGVAALGALWAWWDRQRQDPWQRLQRHIQQRLARLGVPVADHEGPRARAARVRQALGDAAAPLSAVLLDLERARYAAAAGERPHPTNTSRIWKRRFDTAWRDCDPQVTTRSPSATGMRPLAAALIALGLAWGADIAAQANPATRAESASSPAARTQNRAQTPPAQKRKAVSSTTPSAQRASATRPAQPPARPTNAADVPLAYGQRADVARFAAEVAQRRGMDVAVIEKHLAQAQRVPSVQRLIMPPPAGTAKDWAAYRARFVEPRRIDAGLRFWRQHENWLELAEARWGVPASLIVGIIGVETFYGRHTGNFRVIDALATLAFDFPPGRRDRSAFFRSELEELLVWAQHQGGDPSAVKGSYAGAIGLPQFMPGSINRWAVDFDEDGRIDLMGSTADAIGSVANYLAGFGWRRDMPTHFSVAAPVEVADRATLLGPDILPTFTAAEFAARGAVLPPEGQAHAGALALVELQNGDAAPSYVAGTTNFYAVTRYNWSSYYAMAVIELGQAVRTAMRRQEEATPPSAPGSRG